MIRQVWSEFVRWGLNYERDEPCEIVPARGRRGVNQISLCDDEGIDLDNPIKFRVQAVQGGTLVETSWYDNQKDNHIRKMHIVTPDQDLADSIGKIVSMELLRR